MRNVKRAKYPEGQCFRCLYKESQKQVSLWKGSCFENSNLKLEMIKSIEADEEGIGGKGIYAYG